MSGEMKHTYKDAFQLMTYACKCGHREVIWNSRDGVTPFGLECPSCGAATLYHVDWGKDVYAPRHKPHVGQRFWRNGTTAEAEAIMARRIASCKGTKYEPTPEIVETLMNEARNGKNEFRAGWPQIDIHARAVNGLSEVTEALREIDAVTRQNKKPGVIIDKVREEVRKALAAIEGRDAQEQGAEAQP